VYQESGSEVLVSFWTSEHESCSAEDITYRFEVVADDPDVDTSFVTFAAGKVTWYSDEAQSDTLLTISVTALINLVELGQVVEKTNEF
jgi:hypothetical protein